MNGTLAQLSTEVRRNFKFDLLAGSLTGMLTGAITAFILVQARRIGASPFQVSFLAAVPFIWMLFSPLWVAFFNGKNPFKMVLICDGTARLLLILLLFNTTPGWYLFLFALHYLLGSISATMYGRAMELAYPKGVRGTLMGWVRVGSSLTSLLSTGIAGLLLPLWGVQKLFAFLALFGMGAAFTFGRLRPWDSSPCREPEMNPGINLKIFKSSYVTSIQIIRDDHCFRQYIIALFLFGLANLMGGPVYALYQVDIARISDGFISVLFLVTFGTSLVCYFLGGRFVDQSSPLRLSILVFALGPLVPLLYFMAGPSWFLILAAAIQGVLNAGIDLASLNNVIHFAGEGEVNAYMGVHMNLLGIRGTFGPLLVPLLVQWLTIPGVLWLLFFIFAGGLWVGLVALQAEKNKSVN